MTVAAGHAAKLPLQAQPWLPRPLGKIRDAIASLPADPLQALTQAQSLAQAGWDETELGLLGRKVRAVLKAAPAALAVAARSEGLLPIRLLMLSASTASHLTDALIGTAIRYGFLLEVIFVEYQEPEPWLEGNCDALKKNPPDFTLLASDDRMLKLAAPLGDEEASSQAIEAALGRL